jgi:hypothetical protein
VVSRCFRIPARRRLTSEIRSSWEKEERSVSSCTIPQVSISAKDLAIGRQSSSMPGSAPNRRIWPAPDRHDWDTPNPMSAVARQSLGRAISIACCAMLFALAMLFTLGELLNTVTEMPWPSFAARNRPTAIRGCGSGSHSVWTPSMVTLSIPGTFVSSRMAAVMLVKPFGVTYWLMIISPFVPTNHVHS